MDEVDWDEVIPVGLTPMTGLYGACWYSYYST